VPNQQTEDIKAVVCASAANEEVAGSLPYIQHRRYIHAG